MRKSFIKEGGIVRYGISRKTKEKEIASQSVSGDATPLFEKEDGKEDRLVSPTGH